jgi:hypothetical protein
MAGLQAYYLPEQEPAVMKRARAVAAYHCRDRRPSYAGADTIRAVINLKTAKALGLDRVTGGRSRAQEASPLRSPSRTHRANSGKNQPARQVAMRNTLRLRR